jgi:hypothetical protein
MNLVLLGIMVAAWAYTYYRSSKLRAGVPAGKIQGPTASEGVVKKVVFGTITITDPQVLWWGDTEVRKKSDGVYQYWMGFHFGLCYGFVDKLVDVIYADTQSSLIWATVGTGAEYNSDMGQAALGCQWDANGSEPADGDRIYCNGYIRYGLVSDGTTDDGTSFVDANDKEFRDYLAGAQGTSYVPKYKGLCTFLAKHALTGTSPYPRPWAFTVRRIETRNGGRSEQWYKEKATITFGRNREDDCWKFILQDTSDNSDYSSIDFDDSSWGEPVMGGIGNATMNFVVSEYGPSYHVPVVKTNLAHSSYPTMILGSYPNDQVKTGIKLWMRTDLGSLPAYPLGVRCWHDDSAKLWFNGVAVQLNPTLDSSGNPDQHSSTAVIPASLINSSGPNIVAYRVLDTYDSLGNVIGSSKYIYGGIQVGSNTDNPVGSVDANPAHIIREVLTDGRWGMGYSDSDIDDVAFMEAADTLYAEKLGMSLTWDRKSSIEEFVQEILRHINGVLYVDRETGLFVLKLIRNDYDPDDLVVLNDANIIKVENATRKTLGELVNSVTVTYSSTPRGDTGSVTEFNSALLQVQGGTVNTTVDYPGITQRYNASRLALRDLRVFSTPLLTCEVDATREAASLYPGDPFVLDRPELEIDEIMRVTSIDIGDGVETDVKITCIQDAFMLPSTAPSSSNSPTQLGPVNSKPETENLLLNPGAEDALTGDWLTDWAGGGTPGARIAWQVFTGVPFNMDIPNPNTFGRYCFYYNNTTGGHSYLYQLVNVTKYATPIDTGLTLAQFLVDFVYPHNVLTLQAEVKIGFYANESDAGQDKDCEEWDHDLASRTVSAPEGAGSGHVNKTEGNPPLLAPIGTRRILVRMRWGSGVGADATNIDNLSLKLIFPTPSPISSAVTQTSPGATGDGTTNPWAQTTSPDPTLTPTVSSKFKETRVDSDGLILDTGSDLEVTEFLADWIALSTEGYEVGDKRQVTFSIPATATCCRSVGAGLAAIYTDSDPVWSSIKPGDVFTFKLLEIDEVLYWRVL